MLIYAATQINLKSIMLEERSQTQKATYSMIPFTWPFWKTAIKKNTFESVLMRWMKLKPIIQSEVSQKEKHQYIY